MQPKNATTTVQPLTANSMIEIQPVQMRLEAIEWRNEHSQDLVKTIKKLP